MLPLKLRPTISTESMAKSPPAFVRDGRGRLQHRGDPSRAQIATVRFPSGRIAQGGKRVFSLAGVGAQEHERRGPSFSVAGWCPKSILRVHIDRNVHQAIEHELERHDVGQGATGTDQVDMRHPCAQFASDLSADISDSAKSVRHCFRRSVEGEVAVFAMKFPLDMLDEFLHRASFLAVVRIQ